jgi:HD superfamily phosphodiesterase
MHRLTGLLTAGVAVAGLAVSTAVASTAAAPAPAQDWRASVRELAVSHFKNPAWGYSHCLRDYALAKELAAADHAAVDDDVLFAASFLHDMAAFPPWEDTKADHSDVGARLVDTVLKGTGFPMEKIDAVRGAIRTHMYYRDPVGAEALYLHDADALDWLGAIGVARITALVDPHGGNPDSKKAVAMLTDNLSKVPSRVLSPAGRARVPERQAELQKYLSDLKRESEDLKTL